MYYLGIKCNKDPYNLDYINFYFENYKELTEFAELILKYSNYEYEVVIKKCGDINE